MGARQGNCPDASKPRTTPARPQPTKTEAPVSKAQEPSKLRRTGNCTPTGRISRATTEQLEDEVAKRNARKRRKPHSEGQRSRKRRRIVPTLIEAPSSSDGPTSMSESSGS